MTTLSVWEFPDADGAARAVATLDSLQAQELIRVHDGVVLTWPADKKKPKTRPLNDRRAAGALGGSFWGMLIGWLFLMPLLGMAVGAATGALSGSLSGVGIDERFIRSIQEKITPGTSALFVVTSNAVTDKVAAAFAGQQAELITTNLSAEQEAKLHEVFDD